VVLSRQVQANLGASPNPGRQKGERVRSLSFSVMRDRLAELANASEAVLLLPSGERITLTREQRNALADFIGRMSP
jgi:hypothetical protein